MVRTAKSAPYLGNVGYKVPEIRIANELPMTATGKVKKEELAKLL